MHAICDADAGAARGSDAIHIPKASSLARQQANQCGTGTALWIADSEIAGEGTTPKSSKDLGEEGGGEEGGRTLTFKLCHALPVCLKVACLHVLGLGDVQLDETRQTGESPASHIASLIDDGAHGSRCQSIVHSFGHPVISHQSR